MAYKHQKLIYVSGGGEGQDQDTSRLSVWWDPDCPGHRQLSSCCVLTWQKGWGISLGSLFRGTNSIPECQPTSVLLPGKFHGQRSLVGYSPWCPKELNMTDHTRTVLFLRVPSSVPNHLPSFSPPNTITLGIRFQPTNLGEYKRSLYSTQRTKENPDQPGLGKDEARRPWRV